MIQVNGKSVDFNYPVFESLDITPVTRLRAAPLRDTRFVLDTHLGRLAAYLRLFGYDTLYRNDYDDLTLADTPVNEHRILLTRDRQLLMRKQITHGYYVRATQPRQPLLEVLTRFDLYQTQQPFSRRMHCNGGITPVPKEKILSHLQPRTKAWQEQFRQCSQCNKIYWKGTHYQRMQQLIASINQARDPS